MMLGDADIEGRPDQETALGAGFRGDDFRTDGICAHKTVRPVLFRRTDRNHDTLAAFQIGLDFGPGCVVQEHVGLPGELFRRS